MLRPLRLYILFCILSIGITLRAGNTELKSLTTEDGLSDLLVNAIYKDSVGYVWFGTERGLDRFDGNHIKSYSIPGDELDPRRVNVITGAGDRDIYAGNRQGVYVLKSLSDELVPLFPERINSIINAMSVSEGDKGDILYIGAREGLFKYDTRNDRLTHSLLKPDILSPDNEVFGLSAASSDSLWILGSHDLYLMDCRTDSINRYQLPVKAPGICMAGSGDTLYVATRGDGVLPFDTSTGRFGTPLAFGTSVITRLCTAGGKLYVATDGDGVYVYDIVRGADAGHLSMSSGSEPRLNSNSVYSLLVDDAGLMWLGYYAMGVQYTPHHTELFKTYVEPGLFSTAHKAVRAVYIGDGFKLIGTRDGLYYVDEKRRRTGHYGSGQLGSNIVFCITEDRDRAGRAFYVGTYNGGMHRLELTGSGETSVTPFAPAVIKPSVSVFAVEYDSTGNMWVATSEGLYRFTDGRLTGRYDATSSQLPEGNVYEIYFDSAGRGWVCTENGMAIWDGKTLHADRFPRGFISKTKVRDVFEDSRHTLYFVPDRGPVFHSNLQLTDFGHLSYPAMPSPPMTAFVAEDDAGLLWFGTDKGMLRYDPSGTFRVYSIADGLPNPVFTLCPPFRDSDGNLWFGNSEGLLRLDRENLRSQPGEVAPVVISDLMANGKSIYQRLAHDPSTGRTIELTADEKDLEIRFANFDYVDSRHSTVGYKLDGVDEDWRTASGLQPIHYYDLSPGDYDLRLRRHGDAASETVIHVRKPGVLSLPLLVTVALVVMVLAAAFVLVSRSRRGYGASAGGAEDKSGDDSEEDRKQRYRTTRLSDEECRRLLKVIDRIMKDERPYLNPDLKSSELAEMAGTTSHALSYLFNQYLKKSWYDYVNGYRVEEFKHLVGGEDVSRYTLSALSQKCGFTSRASFFRHFKSITGITPAEYMKNRQA